MENLTNEPVTTNNDDRLSEDGHANQSSKDTLLKWVVFTTIALVILASFGLTFFQSKQSLDAIPSEETITEDDLIDVPSDEVLGSLVGANIMDYDSRVLAILNVEEVGTYFGRPDNGLTLYVRRDEDCTDDCNPSMEPYTTSFSYQPINDSEIAQQLSTVSLESGVYQYTWQGKKLFTYKADRYPNEFLADGLNNNWTIARPQYQY